MLVSAGLTSYDNFVSYKLDLGIIRPVSAESSRELGRMAAKHLPTKVEVESLTPDHFRYVLSAASETWGASRLRQLRLWLRAWIRWLGEEGLITSVPNTGKLLTPTYRPKPKDVVTPEQAKVIWNSGHKNLRCMLALGLFAGTNPSDLSDTKPEHIEGQFFIKARSKTGTPRRAHLPSWICAVAHQALPLRTVHGLVTPRRLTNYWRDCTRRMFGSPFPYTACRTTLRTVCSGVADEVLECLVMGHTPASAASSLGKNAVGLKHYLNLSAVDDEKLRSISKKMTDYLI